MSFWGPVFSEVLVKAHEYAELGCRSRPNMHDLMMALDEWDITPASLIRTVEGFNCEHVPLQQRIRDDTELQNFRYREFPCTDTPAPRPRHVPDHLPPFPSEHTYKSTKIPGRPEYDRAKLREINAKSSREVEANLRRLLLARERQGEKGSVVNYMLQRMRKEGDRPVRI
ncbi:hypothetical protein HK101_004973 [Irineochytrium annulatum]|nr:hypothetical protein HK101_004973 [Irineochytrium annulatum]